ncbi:hypothetical protein MVEN_01343700 [Mycena venus]|uniref:Uncharacterized protein n=1 Tax=Mycena venus TaxID=2733690 RepID=A0A8H6Y1S7_9AGAR|nr:hypothetical protein MVEN_01343700 [Mycena venus]
MQTRRQAREAAELAAALQAVVQPPPAPPTACHNNPPVWAPSFASSLSELTPTSSFVSEAGSNGSLSTIVEAEREDDDHDEGYSVADLARSFGRPKFVNPRAGRSLRTPVQSQSHIPDTDVLRTPRKNYRHVPTEEERRAAQHLRDSEIARSGGLAQLTRNGTLLVSPDPSEEPELERTGSGLGSAFSSPSSRVLKRATAASSRRRGLIQGAKTEVIDPDTGIFVADKA